MTTFVSGGPPQPSSVATGYPVISTSVTSATTSIQSLPVFQGPKSAISGVTSQPTAAAAVVRQCAGCGGDIHDRYLLHAIDVYWHTGCLRCSACHAPLADIGATCFTRSGLILCRDDYLRMFGASGSCAACGQMIGPHEMVLRTPVSPPAAASTTAASSSRASAPTGSSSGTQTSSVYHVQCFACAACHSRLVAGDRYRVVNGHVICGDHDFGTQCGSGLAAKQPYHLGLAHPEAAISGLVASSGASGTGSVAGTAVSKRSTVVGESSGTSLAPSNASHPSRVRQKVF